MGYLPDVMVEELTGSHELGIFMRVGTDPPLHMWTGLHDIGAQIESVDSTGQTYLGAGRLIGLDTLETQINGTSDSVEFTLSGIDPATGDQLIDSIPPVRGCEVTIGITTLDQYWQPMTSIIPIWQGTASHTGESSAVPQGDEPRTVSLSLIVTTGSFTRSRPSQATWTHAAHIAEHPGDLFCQQVARLSRGVQPVWPNY